MPSSSGAMASCRSSSTPEAITSLPDGVAAHGRTPADDARTVIRPQTGLTIGALAETGTAEE